MAKGNLSSGKGARMRKLTGSVGSPGILNVKNKASENYRIKDSKDWKKLKRFSSPATQMTLESSLLIPYPWVNMNGGQKDLAWGHRRLV